MRPILVCQCGLPRCDSLGAVQSLPSVSEPVTAGRNLPSYATVYSSKECGKLGMKSKVFGQTVAGTMLLLWKSTKTSLLSIGRINLPKIGSCFLNKYSLQWSIGFGAMNAINGVQQQWNVMMMIFFALNCIREAVLKNPTTFTHSTKRSYLMNGSRNAQQKSSRVCVNHLSIFLIDCRARVRFETPLRRNFSLTSILPLRSTSGPVCLKFSATFSHNCEPKTGSHLGKASLMKALVLMLWMCYTWDGCWRS